MSGGFTMDRIIFSWGYAFGGVFAFLFHRNQVHQDLKFWKSAGVDILGWGILLGLVNRITTHIIGDSLSLAIIQQIFLCTIWGFVGAWRFNKFRVEEDFSRQVWRKREIYASITGILLWIVFTIVSMLPALINTTNNNVSASGQQSELFFIENSYACDKFFEVSAGMPIETNEQVAKAVERIHIYCPEERIVQDTTVLSTVVSVFPQLKDWNWDKDFIHTYQAENGRTAYYYIKQIIK